MLSIIIPTYNEGENLQKILEKIQQVDLPVQKEIIVVDDGSTDNTRHILKNCDQKNIRVYNHVNNRGKGWAVRTGIRYATGDIIIIQDADLEYDPNDYPQLIIPIIEGKTSVVYGSRRISNSRVSYSRYLWGSQFLTFVANILYSLRLTDLYTCYKVLKRDVLEDIVLKCRGFEFCPEITAKISKRNYDILEVPISYHPRSFSEGKKIRWHDGLVGLWTLIRYRTAAN